MSTQQDQKSIREAIKDRTSRNATLQELISKNDEEGRRLKTENGTLTESLELSIWGKFSRSARRLAT